MIAKWSERFMADCGSHQRNPQIPSKMDKFKTKMLGHLQSQGKCLKETDEFTKPKNGQIVAKIDPYQDKDFKFSFDLMIKTPEENFSNIIFATSASPETLANADYNDLLKIRGDVPKGSSYPEIDRHPAIWVMPGNESDEKVGLMMCGEYIQWDYDWNPKPRPVSRCWSHENVEAWKQLTVGKWLVFSPYLYLSTKRSFSGIASNSGNGSGKTGTTMNSNMAGVTTLQLVILQESLSVVMM